MRKTLLASVLGLAMTLPATAGEITGSRSFGNWTAYKGRTAESEPLCGLGTLTKKGAFWVKAIAGADTALMHITKQGWTIPEGRSVVVLIHIDDHTIAYVAEGEGDDLFIELPAGAAGRFFSRFNTGLRMTIEFPGGDEPKWELSLRGSAAAAFATADCLKRAQRPTQPFGASAPTQPFKPEV